MAAVIERSLLIGMLKTRFDIFDTVKLRLNDGKIVAGEIIDMDDDSVAIEAADGIVHHVHVSNIKDYIADERK